MIGNKSNLQAERAGDAGFDGNSAASLARASRDDIAVSRGDVVDRAESVLDGGAGGVGNAQGSSRGELVELDATGTGHGEVRGLEVRLLGEKEDNAALLAGVALRNIKVEDGAVASAQIGVVLSSVRSAGLILVDGDDGVRGLVSTTTKGSLASLAVSVATRGAARSRSRGCRLGASGLRTGGLRACGLRSRRLRSSRRLGGLRGRSSSGGSDGD